MKRVIASLLLASSATLASAAATQPEPVRYVLRFPAAAAHYVEVEAVYPAANRQQIEVMMAVWSPGSYLVREFERNVENVSAWTDGGQSLPVEKTRKNRWRFPTRGAAHVTLRYRVYGRELAVQTNFIDSDFALLNGPATYIAPVGRLRGPFEVRLELPPSWSRSLSSLTALEPNGYGAADFDDLADSPIVAGNPAVHEFTVDGRPHFLVNVGGETFWDPAQSVRDVQKIVEVHRSMWGQLPYDRYIFFNFIVDARGGLEHKNSTVLMTRRYQMRTRKGSLDWLALVSHELFHAWNVKRLRPLALGPFDYENENYTTNLWVAEGFTEYYDSLQVERAGLMTQREYLKRLSEIIDSLQSTPGRLAQPVSLASFDAWIKLYRRDENTVNTTISYYTKGALVGWLLDARLRRATGDRRTLDDLMRTLYQRYSGARGFTTEGLLAVVGEIGNVETASWLRGVIGSTDELDYSDALQWFGLELSKAASRPDDDDKPVRAYLGLTTKNQAGRLVVAQVTRDTPAFAAGVSVDDEIVALDAYTIPPDGLEARLEQYRAGDEATLTVARRGLLRQLAVKFENEPKKWRLKVDEKATADQGQHLRHWLQTQETSAQIAH